MLRSAIPEINMRSTVHFASQPMVLRYPEEESLVNTTDLQKPGIQSIETKPEMAAGWQTPEEPTKQRLDISPSLSPTVTAERQHRVPKQDQEAPPVVVNLPPQPVVQTKENEKTKTGWRLPSIFRKWQERSKVEKTTQIPVDDSSHSNVQLSSPPPSPEKKPEIKAPSAPLSVQATPDKEVVINKEFEQPSMVNLPTSSIPLARPVFPRLPGQPTQKEVLYARNVASVQESAPQPSAAVPLTKAGEDLSWRRLQTILRKHEEKRAAEDTDLSQKAPSVEEELPSPQTAQESLTEEPGPEVSSPILSGAPHLQKASQPSETTPPSAEASTGSSIAQIENDQPMRPEGMENLSSTSSGETHVTEIGIPKVERSTRRPLAQSSSQKGAQPLKSLDTDQTPQITSASEYEATQPMPLPLEEVWPVQKEEIHLASAPPTPAPHPYESHLPGSPPLFHDEEDRLRQVVQKAKTGQPTDSSVEVILPRSPRPTSIQKVAMPNQPQVPSLEEEQPGSTPGNLVDHPTSLSEAEDYPAVSDELGGIEQKPVVTKSVQRNEINPREDLTTSQVVPDMQIPSTSQAAPDIEASSTSQPVPPQQTIPTSQDVSPSQAEQGNPEASASPIKPVALSAHFPQVKPAPQVTVPKMVPTEIGPLPSDLWQLIGQTPPVQPVARIIPEATPSETKVQATIQEKRHPVPPELSSKPVVETADDHYVAEPPPTQAIPEAASKSTPASGSSTYFSEDASQRVLQEIENAEKPGVLARSDEKSPQTFIQRQVEGDQASTPESSAPSEGEEIPQQKPDFTEEELDKLARQVYAEIRHKLSIDRERNRGWV
jgi:hypothetical protein